MRITATMKNKIQKWKYWMDSRFSYLIIIYNNTLYRLVISFENVKSSVKKPNMFCDQLYQ